MSIQFKAAFGIKNPHSQTIYATLFRKKILIDFKIEKFILSDEDFLECYWNLTNKQDNTKPLVIIFHGLTGSYASSYIQGIMQKLYSNDLDSVLMHFRGCSGKENLKERAYHSGDSDDALEFMQALRKRFPHRKLYCVGYSLGANMLLKLLGEEGKDSLIEKAVAISPPFLLDICANKMKEGFSRYYQYRLIKDLKLSLDKKYIKHPMNQILKLKRENIKNLKTFWEYDSAYTAPIHGFTSVDDYYTKCSSKQFLKDIQTKTLIIHSKDDPFMHQEVIPNETEVSKYVDLEITNNGGHVGFVGGSIFKPKYWLEERIIEFLESKEK